MAGYLPITLRAMDDKQNVLFEYAVPFEFGISAKQLLERAFVLAQTGAKADPFLYTIEYFGYSESAQFPGYLGYEIESIAGLPNDAQFFWDLILDGVSPTSGADTTFPNPGGTVVWQYTPIPAQSGSARAAAVQNRRAARTKL
jgi:hypothetical protein